MNKYIDHQIPVLSERTVIFHHLNPLKRFQLEPGLTGRALTLAYLEDTGMSEKMLNVPNESIDSFKHYKNSTKHIWPMSQRDFIWAVLPGAHDKTVEGRQMQ